MGEGRRNVVAGTVAIFLAAFYGMYLGFSLDPLFEEGYLKLSYARNLLKAGHSHGMPFALYNLIVAALMDRVTLGEKGKRWLSWGAVGALVMPVGLILRGAFDGTYAFAPVVMVGAFSFLLSAGLLLKGATNPR